MISQARPMASLLLSLWERIEVRVNCFATMIALTLPSPKGQGFKNNFI